MDIRCSNHVSENKQWLINFDSGRRTKINCVDDEYLAAKGMRNVLVKVRDGKIMLIKYVWYVPAMKNNLMSVG